MGLLPRQLSTWTYSESIISFCCHCVNASQLLHITLNCFKCHVLYMQNILKHLYNTGRETPHNTNTEFTQFLFSTMSPKLKHYESHKRDSATEELLYWTAFDFKAVTLGATAHVKVQIISK